MHHHIFQHLVVGVCPLHIPHAVDDILHFYQQSTTGSSTNGVKKFTAICFYPFFTAPHIGTLEGIDLFETLLLVFRVAIHAGWFIYFLPKQLQPVLEVKSIVRVFNF